MQAGEIWYHNRTRSNCLGRISIRIFFRHRDRDAEKSVLSCPNHSRGAVPISRTIAVRNDDLRQETLCVRREIIEVELNQWGAGPNDIAGLHRGLKTFPLQSHGIDPNMEQNLRTL